MAISSNLVLQSFLLIASRTGIVIGVVLFNFAVIGVFGLPCAITSSVLGIAFSIATVVVTNKRAQSASR